MNVKMWAKALRIIPSVTKPEWDALDFVSQWLVATRAAVLVMTLVSAMLAGLFALRDGGFQFVPWLVMTVALLLAHATNNLVNDYTDFVKGVDTDNYYRTLYGPQPLVAGLLNKRELLTWAAVTGLIAVALGAVLVVWRNGDPLVIALFVVGVLLVLAYTWPLKYLALGEAAVLLAWGPFMIAGGYYTLTGHWSWNVVWACLPYALGVTTVIFGKHIDKIELDRAKGIHTLPVVLGERLSRWTVILMLVLPYFILAWLVFIGALTPAIAVVLLAVPSTVKSVRFFLKPRPSERPEGYPDGNGGWPLYFVARCFVHNRIFGAWFLLGLITDVVWHLAVKS